MNKSTVRTCKFCNEKFSLPRYLPYYSCAKCRKKEEHERSLVLIECAICGKQISTSKQTLICKACAAALAHSDKPKQTCTICDKQFISVAGELACNHCRKEQLRQSQARRCMFCGTENTKSKVCRQCQLKGAHSPQKICLCCSTIFPGESDVWTDNAFCSHECKHTWLLQHTTNKNACITKEDIEAKISELLLGNPKLSSDTIIRALGLNAGTLVRKNVRISEIRKQLNLPSQKYKGSLFEDDVYDILVKEGLDVKREYTFPDLKCSRYLRYDFYIPQLNLLVEADGEQHYTHKTPWENTKTVVKHDSIKNAYARENGINLLRVRYFRYYNKLKVQNFRTLIQQIQCSYQETGKIKLFNCWDGSKLIPISSEACPSGQERSTTIPEGSTDEANASGNGSYPNK